MFLGYLDELCSGLLFLRGLNHRHEGFFDTSLFHPLLGKGKVRVEVLGRCFHCMLDSDDVQSREVLEVEDGFELLAMAHVCAPSEGEIEHSDRVYARLLG